MARPKLAWYSASETAWFGVEHLPFGYRDFTRLPQPSDGVWFTAPFVDGKPGAQIERIPPYVATLNPGWDGTLPLYRPLAMFEAEKAALAPDGPRPCPWDHRVASPPRPDAAAPTLRSIGFLGPRDGSMARRLTALGVPLGDGDSPLTLADAGTMSEADVSVAQRRLAAGATVLLFLDAAPSARVAPLLPGVGVTERTATMLVADSAHPWTAPLAAKDLYFAEEGADRFIQRHGLTGALVDGGHVLLRASDTDWSLFNEAPENAKCAALLLGEQLLKPPGAALVARAAGPGQMAVCSLDPRDGGKAATAFWRRLLANMGVVLAASTAGTPAFDEHNALVNALVRGPFDAPDVEAALAKDFIGEATVRPASPPWKAVSCPSHDRFLVRELGLPGPPETAEVPAHGFCVYFSYWIRSPRALDDLLAGGPDVPRFQTTCYAAERLRLFLNGRDISPTRTEPADYRTLYQYDGMPLRRGWNHFLLKLAGRQLDGQQPATLAVRIGASQEDYLRQLDTAADRPGGD